MISAAPVMILAVDATPPTTASVVEPVSVVALLDPAHQEDLVVHRESKEHRKQEQRHPGVDGGHFLESEEACTRPRG